MDTCEEEDAYREDAERQRRPVPPQGPRGQGAPRRCPLFRDPVLPVRRGCEEGHGPPGRAVSVARFKDDTRDWRKLKVADVLKHMAVLDGELKQLESSFSGVAPHLYPHDRRSLGILEDREGLLTAIVVGILQACNLGSYWTPSFEDGNAKVTSGIRVPMSQLVTEIPDTSGLEARFPSEPSINVLQHGPLQICCDIAAETHRLPQRVALVRFTAVGDSAGLQPVLRDSRASELFLRTSYAAALQDAARHIHADPMQAVDDGGVVYTSDVTILRESVEQGAAWTASSVQFDVIWAALPRHPSIDSQDQYAKISEKADIMERIDMIFACAAIRGIEVLIFPPLGVGGAAGCHHPASDAGDLLRKACLVHAPTVPRIYVCQDHPAQIRPATWDVFTQAVRNGRPPISLRVGRRCRPVSAQKQLAKPAATSQACTQ